MSLPKREIAIYSPPGGHWVGDGFPVKSLLSHQRQGPRITPFLLLDHAGPADFKPSDRRRGVGEHPHRGFETVTLIYSGEVEHRDSAGHSGRIGPGDVQWMTAGSGVVHEELHSEAFTRAGGTLEMVQLWVNLPARHKMTEPRYQDIGSATIPSIELADGAGHVRVIAGMFGGVSGPARTFTPLEVWDARLVSGKSASFPLRSGATTMVCVLHGTVVLDGEQPVQASEVALVDGDGGEISLQAKEHATVLLLSGEPIDEPIASHGPFVMNTREELVNAVEDFQAGRMGRLEDR